MENTLITELLQKGILIGDGITGYKINPYLEMPRSLGYQDVALLQNRGNLLSRSNADTYSEIARGVFVEVPLLSANMSTVTNCRLAAEVTNSGGLGVLHRAWKHEQAYLQNVMGVSTLTTRELGAQNLAASVGIGQSQIDLAKKLIRVGVNILVIDIAHGFVDGVYHTAKVIKDFSPSTKVIAGNTTNVKMMYEFDDVVDAIKIGVGQGRACSTKNTAGVTEKMFSTVTKFSKVSKYLGLPIIADGGIREPADFVKAIAAGANGVMAGSIFARCPSSAAKLVDGKKVYAGMASAYVQNSWHGAVKNDCAEGKVVALEVGCSVEELMNMYAGALRSGISYAGATNIQELQEMAEFTRL